MRCRWSLQQLPRDERSAMPPEERRESIFRPFHASFSTPRRRMKERCGDIDEDVTFISQPAIDIAVEL